MFVIGWLAYGVMSVCKLATTHREEMEYARQGVESPRQREKRKQAQAYAKANGVPYQAPPSPGARGYLKDLWHDIWEDATERRRANLAKKKAGERDRIPTRVWKGLKAFFNPQNWLNAWRWATTPLGEKYDRTRRNDGDEDYDDEYDDEYDGEEGDERDRRRDDEDEEGDRRRRDPDDEEDEIDPDACYCPDCGAKLDGSRSAGGGFDHPDTGCDNDGRHWDPPGGEPDSQPEAERQPDPETETERQAEPEPQTAENEAGQGGESGRRARREGDGWTFDPATDDAADEDWGGSSGWRISQEEIDHLYGRWCGNPYCGCTCVACHADVRRFSDGTCDACQARRRAEAEQDDPWQPDEQPAESGRHAAPDEETTRYCCPDCGRDLDARDDGVFQHPVSTDCFRNGAEWVPPQPDAEQPAPAEPAAEGYVEQQEDGSWLFVPAGGGDPILIDDYQRPAGDEDRPHPGPAFATEDVAEPGDWVFPPYDVIDAAGGGVYEQDGDGGWVFRPANGDDPIPLHRKDAGPAGNTEDPTVIDGEFSTSNGETTMAGNTLEYRYNRIIAEHEAALEKLRDQLDRVTTLRDKMADAKDVVDGIDQQRHEVVHAMSGLATGLEEGRFDGPSIEGSVETATALRTGVIANLQEMVETVYETCVKRVEALEAAIANLEASKQHIESKYGEIARGVQETGVKGEAMEEDAVSA